MEGFGEYPGEGLVYEKGTAGIHTYRDWILSGGYLAELTNEEGLNVILPLPSRDFEIKPLSRDAYFILISFLIYYSFTVYFVDKIIF